MTQLAGRTVLVTGAGSGIGRRLALLAAGRGATVVGWDLDQERLDLLLAELGELGGTGAGRSRGYVCNVADRAAVTATAERVQREVGPVDVLINNAGVVSGRLLGDLTDEQILRTFDVNVLALYWTTRAFLPSMIARGSGHIVTMASAAGLVGVVRQTDYSASKHAAVGFDESLRVELRRTAPGVRTTVVCPFYVHTGMFDGVASRWPLLLPILEERDVCEKIIRSVEKNRRRLVMPPFVKLLPATRLLPVPLFDKVMDVLGVNVSMDEFVGRAAPATAALPATTPEAIAR